MMLDPRLGLAAAAFLLAGTAGSALAHPHPDGDGEEAKRFVIIHDGKGGEHHAKGDRVRRVEIIREGEHHAGAHGPRVRHFEMRGHGALADCEGGEKIVDESDDDGDKKTKVVICTRGERPTAATAERIEEALARIKDNDHLSDEQKARIETALRSAMDRARSAR